MEQKKKKRSLLALARQSLTSRSEQEQPGHVIVDDWPRPVPPFSLCVCNVEVSSLRDRFIYLFPSSLSLSLVCPSFACLWVVFRSDATDTHTAGCHDSACTASDGCVCVIPAVEWFHHCRRRRVICRRDSDFPRSEKRRRINSTAFSIGKVCGIASVVLDGTRNGSVMKPPVLPFLRVGLVAVLCSALSVGSAPVLPSSLDVGKSIQDDFFSTLRPAVGFRRCHSLFLI